MVTTVTTRRPVSTEQARSIRLKPTFTPVVQCRICGNTQFVEILDLDAPRDGPDTATERLNLVDQMLRMMSANGIVDPGF